MFHVGINVRVGLVALRTREDIHHEHDYHDRQTQFVFDLCNFGIFLEAIGSRKQTSERVNYRETFFCYKNQTAVIKMKKILFSRYTCNFGV